MTMSKAEVLLRIRSAGLVAVLRADTEGEALALAEALVAGGVDVLELTMTVPGALSLLPRLRRQYPHLLLGVGTVLDPETARQSIVEGAQFVVSPGLNVGTVEVCRHEAVAVIPGALTPTEIVTAWQAGADAVKVFPADAMGGAPYLRSLRGPLPEVPLIPTGGVSLATARAYLEAGAVALGVGGDLVDAAAIRRGDPASVIAKAKQYREILREFRSARREGSMADTG